MQYQGNINKMHTSLVKGEATYHLPIGDDTVPMNALVGQKIKLTFDGQINCIGCGISVKKTYSQGYCFQCAQTLARCDLCIMRPETCHHHLGTCREPLWGLDNCFSPHVVYIANSSGVKVGITRKQNIPSRFIDQGAVEFLPLFEVDTRLKAGKIEHHLKSIIADKTNWRNMLKNELSLSNLMETKDTLTKYAAELINELSAKPMKEEREQITYPVRNYPTKITSLNLDKTPEIHGMLEGIKGQYLIFDSGVINIRKYSGYYLTIDF